MKPICLSPLPAHRGGDQTTLLLMEREGFVDEAVVTALLSASHPGRTLADPDDLALAADDLDFAGWRLSKSTTVRSAEVPPQVIDAIVRRSSPPVPGGPKCKLRQSENRWWLPGLAAVLIFPVVVFLLPSFLGMYFEPRLSPSGVKNSEPISLKSDEPVKESREPTELSLIGR